MNRLRGLLRRLWRHSAHAQQGMSLMEVLAAIVLLSIVPLGLTYSTILSYKTIHRNERHSLASQLALDRMEDLAAMNPANLSNALDEVENNLIVENASFTRVTDVTLNPDNSRTVTVTVTGNDPSLGGRATVTSTFALWGTN